VQLCKYDLNLSYPQPSKFPSLEVLEPNRPDGADALLAKHGLSLANLRAAPRKSLITDSAAKHASAASKGLVKREVGKSAKALEPWKRSLAGFPNGTINEWYGCFLRLELEDYAFNFTYPWSE
jgi:carboxypeptidase D